MIALVLLAAADFEPWLKLIGLVIAVSIMAINHLLAGLKKARAQLPPPPPNATPAYDPAAAATRDDLNAEVKEFLRRAAQQRAGQQPAPVRPSASNPPVRTPPNVPAADRRQESQRKQRGKTQPSKPTTPGVPKVEESLAKRRVTSRLETSALDERAQQLSSLDKKNEIEQHIEQTLDRPVGQLTSGLVSTLTETSASATPPEVVETPTGAGAAEVVAALRSPQSIRTAVILNEILTRPTDRW